MLLYGSAEDLREDNKQMQRIISCASNSDNVHMHHGVAQRCIADCVADSNAEGCVADQACV